MPEKPIRDIFAVRRDQFANKPPLPGDDEIEADWQATHEKEKREFSRKFREELEKLGFTITERPISFPTTAENEEKWIRENRRIIKKAYSGIGKFEARREISRNEGTKHELLLVYTPTDSHNTDIAMYVDGTQIQGNHDANVSEIAAQLKYAWDVALTGRGDSGEESRIDEATRKLIRSIGDIR